LLRERNSKIAPTTSPNVTTNARNPGPPENVEVIRSPLQRLSCLSMGTPIDDASLPDAAEDEASASPRHASRRAKAWGWVGVGVLVLIASWFGWQSAQQPLRWNDVGFDIISPTEADATFDIFFYKDTDAVCHLRALNSRFAEVGVADVTVKRADGDQQRITGKILTTEEATTAVVKYCEPVD